MFSLKLHSDKESISKLFISSDPHYNHLNICSATTRWDHSRAENSVRKFDSLAQMNDRLVNEINNVVGQDDHYFCLGDWSFGGFDKIKEFRDRIVCKNVYLITGNHDHHQLKNKDNIRDIYTQVFEHMLDFEVEYYHKLNKRMEKVKFVLCHYPIASWTDMAKGRIHLHGHVHLKPIHKIGKGKSIDVGVDGNDYRPYEFREIIKIMDNQPINSLLLPEDHHIKPN